MRSVRDIMTTAVLSLTPDMRLARAAALLDEHQISGAPVCEEGGRVLGVLSRADLTESFGQNRHRTVGELMTPEALTVRSDDPIERAIQRMAFEGVHRLVVVDERGRLEGMVSSMDVLRELAGFPSRDTRVIAVAPPEDRTHKVMSPARTFGPASPK
jgi:predicted transcriptional regulator